MAKPQRVKSLAVQQLIQAKARENNNVSTQGDNLESTQNSVVSTQGDSLSKGITALPLSEIEPWNFADRPDDEYGDDEEWHQFVQSIKVDGVDQPITVRPKKDGNGYEMICGRRRYTASKECNLETIPAIIRNLTDREAAAVQDRENDLRKSISPWGRAIHWQRLLDTQVFDSHEQLGASMGIERKNVSKMMSFCRIDGDIADAIKSKSKVSLKTAIAIISLTRISDTQSEAEVAINKQIIIDLADKISEGKLNDLKLKAAVEKAKSTDEKPAKEDTDKFKDMGVINGVKYFNIRTDSNGTPVISLMKESRELVSLDQISEHLKSLFENAVK